MLFIGNYYEPNSINGGFVYMFPTNTTRQVLHILVEQMVNPAEHIQGLSNKDEVPEKENDQVYLSKLVREEYAGLKHFVLPYSYFTEGVWYTMTKEKKLTLDPFVIHNDYVSGNDKKINRVKQFGHWFLNNDNTCNYQKVNSILNNYIQLIQTYSLAP
jgi:PDZ domain-containing secreted protein